MSRLDEYEHRRGPIRRRFKGRKTKLDAPGRGAKVCETQLALRLLGGLTERERKEGTPFDDAIPF